MKQAVVNFEAAAKEHYTGKEKAQVEQLRGEGGIRFFMLVAAKLAEKYTNCAHYKGREAHDGLTLKWTMRLLTSKDWKWADFIATMKMAGTPGKAYDRLWNSLLDIDLTEIYHRIELPTLILQGSEELYVLPQRMQELAVQKSNITYVKYDDCGHIPTSESFPKMLNKMVEFAK
jgi:pimeloyl-ACP methyl ester carboxylesterase